jgi:pyridoxine 5-phosphate synthase
MAEHLRLDVNVGPIAALRQSRRSGEPDPVQAAVLAELGGAGGIAVRLRADRRPVQDRDVEILRQVVRTRLVLRMGATQDMVRTVLAVGPDQVTLVLERAEEDAPAGALDVILNSAQIKPLVKTVRDASVTVSLFVEPEPDQVKAAHKAGATAVELSMSAFADAPNEGSQTTELRRVVESARLARKLGLAVHAGHGLGYANAAVIAAVSEISVIQAGHAVAARAVLTGMERAVRDMVEIFRSARVGL